MTHFVKIWAVFPFKTNVWRWLTATALIFEHWCCKFSVKESVEKLEWVLSCDQCSENSIDNSQFKNCNSTSNRFHAFSAWLQGGKIWFRWSKSWRVYENLYGKESWICRSFYSPIRWETKRSKFKTNWFFVK